MAALSRVSSYYLSICKPFLYRDVHLSDKAAKARYEFGDGYESEDDEKFLALASEHPEMNKKTTFQLFRDTVMARPDHFGPLVKSLHLTGYYYDIRFDKESTITLFRALCNVITLEVDSEEKDNEEGGFLIFHDLHADVFPRLREFHTSTSPFENPGYQDFLDSHLELIRWHFDGWTSFPILTTPGLARIRHFSSAKLPDMHTLMQLLRTMPNLTHLSIPGCFDNEVPEHLEALLNYFANFGAGIVELSMCSELSETFETFECLLRQVVPSLPALRRFNFITDLFPEDNRRYTPVVPSTIDSRPLLDISFPPHLETIEWTICTTDLSPPPVLGPPFITRQGSSNAKELFSIIRSLRTVIYREHEFEFLYTALDGGKIHVSPEERFHRVEDSEEDEDDEDDYYYYSWSLGRVPYWLLG